MSWWQTAAHERAFPHSLSLSQHTEKLLFFIQAVRRFKPIEINQLNTNQKSTKTKKQEYARQFCFFHTIKMSAHTRNQTKWNFDCLQTIRQTDRQNNYNRSGCSLVCVIRTFSNQSNCKHSKRKIFVVDTLFVLSILFGFCWCYDNDGDGGVLLISRKASIKQVSYLKYVTTNETRHKHNNLHFLLLNHRFAHRNLPACVDTVFMVNRIDSDLKLKSEKNHSKSNVSICVCVEYVCRCVSSIDDVDDDDALLRKVVLN